MLLPVVHGSQTGTGWGHATYRMWLCKPWVQHVTQGASLVGSVWDWCCHITVTKTALQDRPLLLVTVATRTAANNGSTGIQHTSHITRHQIEGVP